MEDKKLKSAKPKILVLDDEPAIVEVFSSLMKQLGYDAEFFQDGLSALEAVTKNPDRYRIVITDIKMPRIDGISLAKKIRAVCPDLPIVFMTGFPSEEIKNQAFELRKVTFLEKPFHLERTFEELIPRLLSDGSQ